MPCPCPPVSFHAPKMPSAITIAGGAVDWKPCARPWMMFVACPVCDARAVLLTGANRVEVK